MTRVEIIKPFTAGGYKFLPGVILEATTASGAIVLVPTGNMYVFALVTIGATLANRQCYRVLPA
jgi:hypothetical protein